MLDHNLSCLQFKDQLGTSIFYLVSQLILLAWLTLAYTSLIEYKSEDLSIDLSR